MVVTVDKLHEIATRYGRGATWICLSCERSIEHEVCFSHYGDRTYRCTCGHPMTRKDKFQKMVEGGKIRLFAGTGLMAKRL